jgi:glycosidase
MSSKQLSAIDFSALTTSQTYFPSPIAWEDQVFYFLMIDRFSDGKENSFRDNEGNLVQEGTTPLYTADDAGNAIKTEDKARKWREAGTRYVGGNLRGLTQKIGYLRRLGVTAIWISPIFKQVAFQESYHGYGIQDFLEVEPHFGTREDLKELVRVAHENGVYVILDIILNHSGNVFSYDPNRYWTEDPSGNWYLDPRWDGDPYEVKGFNFFKASTESAETLPFIKTDPNNPVSWPNPDAAIWPVEFQDPACFTQKGRIDNWDYDPEFREGDFCVLKDINHGYYDRDKNYHVSNTLRYLCKVYQYWIADADIDGYRIDTVKHMDVEATRYFVSVIHEFAQTLGKENFFLLGEVAGDRKRAFETLELAGLSAVLGIADIPSAMEYLVKGYRNPNDYFSLFRNSEQLQKDSHIWFRSKVVTSFDDHDRIGRRRARFCADQNASKVVLNVLALNALTLGIPCIYYGSEQCFDGQDIGGNDDRYIREAMFGGAFGAFRTKGVHFFNENNPVYQELTKILEIRRQHMVLRRGRQYLRPISAPEDGVNFGLPGMIGGKMRSVVPWSRIFNDQEMLLAINTDYDHPTTAWVTIDNGLHQTGDQLRCLYSTDATQVGQRLTVEARNGKAVSVTVPAAGFVIFT